MTRCESCVNRGIDEDGQEYCACAYDLDEDEMSRLLARRDADCPFYEPGDEYKLVQKQN